MIEQLECRRFLAGDPAFIQALPFQLDFSSNRGGILDKDGLGTGFTYVQPNSFGNDYDPSLLDLRPGAGVLNVTSSGSAAHGGNFGNDNSLVNGLQTTFAASSKPFTITVRLRGPLSALDRPIEQAGVMFGPDQENFVKLVAVAQPDGTRRIQFIDEQKFKVGYRRQLGEYPTIDVGPFPAIQSLELMLAGDPRTGRIRAFYNVNDTGFIKIEQELRLVGGKAAAFFAPDARAGILVMHKNDEGPVTVSFDRFEIVRGTPRIANPSVVGVRPGNGATGVPRDAFMAADLRLPTEGKGVNTSTLTSNTVKLYRTSDGAPIAAVLNSSGGGDAIVLQPRSPLQANTNYTFEVTSGLRDLAGASFVPFKSTFTTGTMLNSGDPGIAFEKVALPTATGQSFSGVTIGPDGKLYATALSGHIFRYSINPDGTLSDPQVISTIRTNNGGARFVTGLEFDPASTADNLVAWVTHSQSSFTNGSDWTGKLSRLSGSNLQNYQDYVVGLPRSIRDHLTNQIDFGPDGRLYFTQASNSAMGAADNTWGNRPEHLLNAAVLAVDLAALRTRIDGGQGPLDVRTDDAGNYDPFAAGAPLTIYASGIRNGYDLVWHSNGELYVPGNGSAAGGNTPGTPSGGFTGRRIDQDVNGPYDGTVVPPLGNVQETQSDYLFRVRSGKYYGHPNPIRGEYVMNGGNPTSGMDDFEVATYPVGTAADRNYDPPVWAFGRNYSANGIIEYKSNTFGGKLKGSLLVARYSGGDDVLALQPGAGGAITGTKVGIAGLSQFVDPVDLIEDTRNGNLYVVEYGAGMITLVRPINPGPDVGVNSRKRVFNDPRGGDAGPTRKVAITNRGAAPLTIPADGIQLTGENDGQFDLVNLPSGSVVLAAGETLSFGVRFDPSSVTSLGVKTAAIEITTNDPNEPLIRVRLRGLATSGTGGSNEPSLQRVLEVHQIPVAVGDSRPETTGLDELAPSEEVGVQSLVKVGAGPVTIETLAVFGLAEDDVPTFRFGYYEPGSPATRTELFTVDGADSQSVHPTPLGATSFDPGGNAFGLYVVNPPLTEEDGTHRTAYSEEVFNTWDSDPANRRKIRFYPLRNPDKSVVPNAYVFAVEEFVGRPDQQDLVGIIRNVRRVLRGPEIGLANLNDAPFPDRMVFNKLDRLDPNIPNIFHDIGKVRVRNAGARTLIINATEIRGPFELLGGGGTISLAPGKFKDLAVRFTATEGRLHFGSLRLFTNDPDEPVKVIELAGNWQSRSENNQEPKLQTLMNLYGYKVAVDDPDHPINNGGKVEAVGDEVLSPYWNRVDPSQPVRVLQLNAFHTQGNPATLYWHAKGSNSANAIVTHEGADSQSLFPRMQGSNAPTSGAFEPNSVFGFKVDGEWSDDTKNPQENGASGHGHHFRFYPVRDRRGFYVPDTFLITMDYTGVNYDYNDNVYLVSNMRPEFLPATPMGFAAYGTQDGVILDWADGKDSDLAGYHVYRSHLPDRGFTRLTGTALTTSQFVDSAIEAGATRYYRVVAVTNDGTASIAASAAASRPLAS